MTTPGTLRWLRCRPGDGGCGATTQRETNSILGRDCHKCGKQMRAPGENPSIRRRGLAVATASEAREDPSRDDNSKCRSSLIARKLTRCTNCTALLLPRERDSHECQRIQLRERAD